jgi:multidrug efflux pump subunit AcrB
MTAIAAVAGMLPLAFGLGSGSEMLQPLAIAVIGGILISMALSLLVTPAVYFYLTRRTEAPVRLGVLDEDFIPSDRSGNQ